MILMLSHPWLPSIQRLQFWWDDWGGENGDAARLGVISVPCAGVIYTTECKHNHDQANTMLGTCNSLRGETEGGGPHLGSGTGG